VTDSDQNIAEEVEASTAVPAVASFILVRRSQTVTANDNFSEEETVYDADTVVSINLVTEG
jgi:hypothetical protein